MERISRHKVNQATLSLPSFAKINWSLQILGKRPDGYHEIRTTLQTISLQDVLHFQLSSGSAITLSCDDPTIPAGNENLVIRAAHALKELYEIDYGVHVRLEKRIPTKAGLGGASSNAAVALLGLSQLWRLEAEMPALVEIGSQLGADVPFFLQGGCALATGIGTTLVSLPDAEPKCLVVVSPNAKISTAKAYAAVSSNALTTKEPVPILSSSPGEPDSQDSPLWDSRNDLKNDFESVIFDIEPEIRRAKESLIRAGAESALLAGSGSSVFGIFPDREAQQRALDEIECEVGWRVFPCVTVSRNEYVGALGVSGISL